MSKSKSLFLSCFLITAIFFSWGVIILSKNITEAAKIYKTDIFKKSTNGSDQGSEAIQKKEPFNILILGLDEGGFRSDVIMLMNYTPETGKIKLISIPRDSMVRYKGSTGKINALYIYGKEELIKNTMELFTGLKIDYYITVNLSGFRKVIDTLGGIYVNVPINMDYDDPQQGLSIHLKKGYQLLSGQKAEDFIRYRKSSLANGIEIGDLGRIEMQGYLIKELFRQKLDVKYISKADEICSILLKSIRTNIGINDIKDYLPYALNIRSQNIESYIVPGQSSLIDEIWYYMVDTDKAHEIIHDNFATL
jgi:cell envelope-related function transcriptional attenuator common domain